MNILFNLIGNFSIYVIVTILSLIFFSNTIASSMDLKTRTIQNLTSMPLTFTENMGQWDDKVKFRANAGGATMWFAPDGVGVANVNTNYSMVYNPNQTDSDIDGNDNVSDFDARIKYVETWGNDITGTGTSDNPFATIQHTIIVSDPEDIIMIGAGLYTENITINKNLSLIGYKGVDSTTINADSSFSTDTNSAIVIQDVGDVFLSGIKITGRYGTRVNDTTKVGGGIFSIGSTVALENVTFYNCSIAGVPLMLGGGLYSDSSRIVINNSRFDQNRFGGLPYQSSGAAIFSDEKSHLQVNNTVFADNLIHAGAAIYAKCDSVILSSSSIMNNMSNDPYNVEGGAVVLLGDYCQVTDCVFEGNIASSGNYFDLPSNMRGAALYIGGNSSQIMHSIFKNNILNGNRFSAKGGAVYVQGIQCTIDSCIFIENECHSGFGSVSMVGGSALGGSVYFGSGPGWFRWNTLEKNTASADAGGAVASTIAYGGGLYCNAPIEVFNNTFYSNSTSAYSLSGVYPNQGSATAKGGGMYSFSSGIVRNNIFVACSTSAVNVPDSFNATASGGGFYGSDYVLDCNNFWMNHPTNVNGKVFLWEGNNFVENPYFCEPDSSDFSLALNSPCLPKNNQCSSIIGAVLETCSEIPITTWYVSVTGNDITGTGSIENPFATIMFAIDTALSRDYIIVLPGTYYEHLTFQGKSIIVTSNYLFSDDPDDIKSTIIDGSTTGVVVTFNEGDDYAELIGFTITNGYGNSFGGGIACHGSATPRIMNNIIFGNNAIWGGGISILDSSQPWISNNLFYSNSSSQGGAIDCLGNSSPIFMNNTIASNIGGIICMDGSKPQFINCILWNEETSAEITIFHSANPIIEYCNVRDSLWPGVGNISCDPSFCNLDSNNFLFWDSSCCLGTGLDGTNIGAFGIGCVYSCCNLPGDANGDGIVGISDLTYFVDYLFNSGTAPACNEEFDNDGNCLLGITDLTWFVDFMFNAGASPVDCHICP